jgi:hypothetical protein
MTLIAAVRLQLYSAARRHAASRMRHAGTARVSAGLLLLGTVSTCVVACGGIAANAVVQVNGSPITTAAFDHWMRIAATGAAGPSKTVVPKPPGYTACIAQLAATAPKPAKGAKKPTRAQLEAQCASEYESMKTETLGYLISADWLIGEAQAQGVCVSDSEVHSRFISIRQQGFSAKGSFERFLRTSPYTVSDLLLRIKLQMLSERLEKKVLAGAHTVTQAQIAKYYNGHRSSFAHQSLAAASASIKQELRSQTEEKHFTAFKEEFRKRWTARTDCRAGFVVVDCKQYKASGSAGTH